MKEKVNEYRIVREDTGEKNVIIFVSVTQVISNLSRVQVDNWRISPVFPNCLCGTAHILYFMIENKNLTNSKSNKI